MRPRARAAMAPADTGCNDVAAAATAFLVMAALRGLTRVQYRGRPNLARGRRRCRGGLLFVMRLGGLRCTARIPKSTQFMGHASAREC